MLINVKMTEIANQIEVGWAAEFTVHKNRAVRSIRYDVEESKMEISKHFIFNLTTVQC